jgi:hypothetical protein
MRDWVERVCQVQNGLGHRDHVIADQRKAIANQLEFIARLRAMVESIDASAPNSE